MTDPQLDGYAYTNCTFENVTFVFREERPFFYDTETNTTVGRVGSKTISPQLSLFLKFLQDIDRLKKYAPQDYEH
jgi:hypothetical protein